MTLFAIVSFGLHVFSIFFIILLYKKLHRQGVDAGGERLKKEIEDLLIAHTEEMKAENEQLLNKLQTTHTEERLEDQNHRQKEAPSPDTTTAGSKEPENKTGPAKKRGKVNTFQSTLASVQANQSYKKVNNNTLEDRDEHNLYELPVDDVTDKVEQSTEAQVIALYEEGLPPDEIAQKLQIGKGEVDLFLKFRQ
ncbi:hypothetical protein [Salsuginibacillus kocurii]|uniref:hypothetical protein n=1 Tax=Salsuginibacillus kocurii TaxID=427078 RepID=UPI00038038C1|nr:hypothetical protein [Salsuginibacillus kocurii]